MTRFGIYARVSTDHDKSKRTEGNTQSTDRQESGGLAFGQSKGWIHVDTYRDDGVSGALFEGRPELQRMLSDARAGLLDAVVFFDLDRLSRNAQKGMEVLNELLDLGVSVWDFSTGQQVELDSFEGELTVAMKLQLSQLSRREKQKHSRAAAHEYARKGIWMGGAPFGYEIGIGRAHV